MLIRGFLLNLVADKCYKLCKDVAVIPIELSVKLLGDCIRALINNFLSNFTVYIWIRYIQKCQRHLLPYFHHWTTGATAFPFLICHLHNLVFILTALPSLSMPATAVAAVEVVVPRFHHTHWRPPLVNCNHLMVMFLDLRFCRIIHVWLQQVCAQRVQQCQIANWVWQLL